MLPVFLSGPESVTNPFITLSDVISLLLCVFTSRVCDVTGFFTMATGTEGMWTVRQASGNIKEESLHHRPPPSIPFLLQVRGCELANHLHAAATLGPPVPPLSPAELFLHSPPPIKTTLVSSTQRRCHSPKYQRRAH